MPNEKPRFKFSLRRYYEDLDLQSVAVGIFLGYLLTLLITWYANKDRQPYDWCFYLNESKSNYCVDLYDQATRKMQERSDYEEAQQGGVYPYGDSRMR